MSITPTVARRAYLVAVKGNNSQFFYVKHFISANGGQDQFIPVTIRLSGNGAGVPFSLTAIKLLSGKAAQRLFRLLKWKAVENTKFYRIEIEDEKGKKIFSAVVLPIIKEYQIPSFMRALVDLKQLKWQVSAISNKGGTIEKSSLNFIEKP